MQRKWRSWWMFQPFRLAKNHRVILYFYSDYVTKNWRWYKESKKLNFLCTLGCLIRDRGLINRGRGILHCSREAGEKIFIMIISVQCLESFPKINKKQGRGEEHFHIMNELSSWFLRKVRVFILILMYVIFPLIYWLNMIFGF